MTSETTTTRRADTSRTAVFSTVLAVLGTGALLVTSILIGQQGKGQLPLYFLYQGITLVIALIAILAIRFITGAPLRFLHVGNLRAGATPVRVLGVKPGESWAKVGTTYAIIVTAATAVFLLVSYGAELRNVSPAAVLVSILLAVPLSIANAFTEEIVSRWTIAEGFTSTARIVALAPWASAAIFGAIHYFGIPGGPIGAIMAGFLAWLGTRSIQDTGGVGWAFLIHFLQDILIFSVTLSLFWRPS